MDFKWDRDRKKWYGPISLNNLEGLDGFLEVERKRREEVLVIVVSVRSSSVRSAPLRLYSVTAWV